MATQKTTRIALGIFLSATIMMSCMRATSTADANLDFVGNAKAAKIGDFPASIRIVLGDQPNCTGAIIAPNKILTAAHCLVEGTGTSVGDAITILEGTNVDNFTKHQTTIKKMTAPSSWLDAYYRLYAPPMGDDAPPDIAVITLEKDLNIKPSSIAKLSTKSISKGTKIIVGGFGTENHKYGAPSMEAGRLRYAHKLVAGVKGFYLLVAKENADCGSSVLGIGDSGGPVYLENDHLTIVGVNSLIDYKTSKCSMTRIDMTREWVEAAMK